MSLSYSVLAFGLLAVFSARCNFSFVTEYSLSRSSYKVKPFMPIMSSSMLFTGVSMSYIMNRYEDDQNPVQYDTPVA